jgi:hypothetical protein
MNSMQIDPLWDPQLVPEANEGALVETYLPIQAQAQAQHSTGTGTYQKSMANACGTDGRQAGGSRVRTNR